MPSRRSSAIIRVLVRLLLVVSVITLPGSMIAPAWALDPTQPIGDLRHAQWTIADGAPANIAALAQTPDGFIWLGTATGLYRFDGLKFERIDAEDEDPARSLQVTALLATKSGDLWVGYDYGGVALYRNGKLRGTNQEAPKGSVMKFAESPDGTVWEIIQSAVLKNKIRYFTGGRWHWLSLTGSESAQDPQNIVALPDGSVIIALSNKIVQIDRRSHAFRGLAEAPQWPAALALDSKGKVWLVDNRGLQALGSSAKPRFIAKVHVGYINRSLLFDRDGTAWTAGQEHGIARLRDMTPDASATTPQDAPSIERFDGIAGPIGLSLMEDREGNIWVGGISGLDRFSAPDIHVFGGAPAPVTRFLKNPRIGALFFGGSGGLYRVGGLPPVVKPIVPTSHIISNICGDRSGRILILTHGEDLLFDGEKHVSLPRYAWDMASAACASDGSDGWYVSNKQYFYIAAKKAVVATGPLETQTVSQQIRPWRSNDLLFYQALKGLYVLHNGVISPLWQGRDIPIGFIKTIVPSGGNLFIGGEHGLAYFNGNQFLTITDRHHRFFANVSGILPLGDGHTWIISAEGIARLQTADLMAAFHNPDKPLPAFTFGRDQGLRARSNGYDLADAMQAENGLIWFATNKGLAWIDPNKFARNSLPPPVVVRALLADGRSIPVGGGNLRLRAGTQRIEIEFTALSFTDPAANQFRYRLVGVDKEWVDAEGRRQAYYASLAPGHYHFEVVASNGDGVWNRQGASIDFTIAPLFYQTRWFAGLVVMLAASVLVILFRWRTRSIARDIRNRVEARVEERERIARELHDTLLQGLQGLMMRFQAVAEVIPGDSRARSMIEKTLERGDDVIVQSRERVRDLRASAPGELRAHIEALGYEGVEIRTSVSQRPICGPVIDELVAIVSEALANALQHARAKHVIVEILHSRRGLDVLVRDDGDGIDHAILANGGRTGHFGLQGMRERATKLGGTFKIESTREAGTLVHVRVPARIAYRSWTWWPWRRQDERDL